MLNSQNPVFLDSVLILPPMWFWVNMRLPWLTQLQINSLMLKKGTHTHTHIYIYNIYIYILYYIYIYICICILHLYIYIYMLFVLPSTWHRMHPSPISPWLGSHFPLAAVAAVARCWWSILDIFLHDWPWWWSNWSLIKGLLVLLECEKPSEQTKYIQIYPNYSELQILRTFRFAVLTHIWFIEVTDFGQATILRYTREPHWYLDIWLWYVQWIHGWNTMIDDRLVLRLAWCWNWIHWSLCHSHKHLNIANRHTTGTWFAWPPLPQNR